MMPGAYVDSAPARCAYPDSSAMVTNEFDCDRHVDRFIRKCRQHIRISERDDLDVRVGEPVGSEIEPGEEVGHLAARGDRQRHTADRLEDAVDDQVLTRDEELRIAGRCIFRSGEIIAHDRHLRAERERIEQRRPGRGIGHVDLAGRKRGHERRARLEEDGLEIDPLIAEKAAFDTGKRRLRHPQKAGLDDVGGLRRKDGRQHGEGRTAPRVYA